MAPLSKPSCPKQFLNLDGSDTLLGSTLARLAVSPRASTPIHLVASADDEPALKDILRGRILNGGGMLLEPMRRDTAMAVAVATVQALSRYGDTLVLVAPSDHQIETPALFWETIELGVASARTGSLVLFGAVPTRAEAAYGYIETTAGNGGLPLPVRRFHEKPDTVSARHYIEAGNHYWNCGIFLFRAAAMRDRYRALRPDIWAAAEAALLDARKTPGPLRLDEVAYRRAPAVSFDRAIVERTDHVVMVPAGFRWRDMGTWRSVVESALGRW